MPRRPAPSFEEADEMPERKSREELRMEAAMQGSDSDYTDSEDDAGGGGDGERDFNAEGAAPPPRRRRPVYESGGGEDSGSEGDDDGEGASGESDAEEDEEGGSEGSSSGDEGPAEEANVTFEELERKRRDGTTTFADQRRKEKAAAAKRAAAGGGTKRKNKNRPQEMSAKAKVPRMTEVLVGEKRKVRDPRFESLSGTYDESAFRSRYKFVYDEIIPQEKAQLHGRLKKEKKADRRADMQSQLNRLDNQLRGEDSRRKAVVRNAGIKKAQREAVRAGKVPYFLKNSDKRKLELVERFKELKESGKLEKFLEKKRKKNASKDRAHMPTMRRGDN